MTKMNVFLFFFIYIWLRAGVRQVLRSRKIHIGCGEDLALTEQ